MMIRLNREGEKSAKKSGEIATDKHR